MVLHVQILGRCCHIGHTLHFRCLFAAQGLLMLLSPARAWHNTETLGDPSITMKEKPLKGKPRESEVLWPPKGRCGARWFVPGTDNHTW